MTINNLNQLNVLGKKIEICSCTPMTGWFRDGLCIYDKRDGGNHSICCVMDNNFLKYSKSQGNDLITPMAMYSVKSQSIMKKTLLELLPPYPPYSSTFFKEMLVFYYY